jgi:hypothetical protein
MTHVANLFVWLATSISIWPIYCLLALLTHLVCLSAPMSECRYVGVGPRCLRTTLVLTLVGQPLTLTGGVASTLVRFYLRAARACTVRPSTDPHAARIRNTCDQTLLLAVVQWLQLLPPCTCDADAAGARGFIDSGSAQLAARTASDDDGVGGLTWSGLLRKG